MFPPLRLRIEDAVAKLEDQIVAGEQGEGKEEELTRAREVVKEAKKLLAQK